MPRRLLIGLLALNLGACGTSFVEFDSDTDAGSDSSGGPPIDIDSTTGTDGGQQSASGHSSTGNDSVADASSGGDTKGTTGSDTEDTTTGSDTTGGESSSSSGGESSSSESSSSETTDPTGDPVAYAGDYAGTVDALCQGQTLAGDITFNVADDGTMTGTVSAAGLGSGTIAGTVDATGAVDGSANIIIDNCTMDGSIDDVGHGTGNFDCPTIMCTGTWEADAV